MKKSLVENLQNRIFFTYGFLLSLTCMISCVSEGKKTVAGKTSDFTNSTISITQNKNNSAQMNATQVNEDSVSNEAKHTGELYFKDVAPIILNEIGADWTAADGKQYKLTKSSEQDVFERILPVAKKQYDLSFSAQNAKLSEIITESNVETTTTTSGNKTTVVKKKLFSKGDEKLQIALSNIETESEQIARSIEQLSLTPQNDGDSESFITIKNGEQTIRKILIEIHNKAINDSATIYKPNMNEKAERQKNNEH